MSHLTVETSKYILIILTVIYTLLSYLSFGVRKHEKVGKALYNLERIVMFLFHFDAFWVLYLTTKNSEIFVFYISQVIVFLVVIALYKLYFKRASDQLMNNMIFLLMISMVFLTRLSYGKAMRQFIIVLAGITISMIIPLVLREKSIFRKWTWVYAGLGIITLLLVAILGSAIGFGAKLSLSVFGISLQPSEFVKIIFVFFIASMLRNRSDLKWLALCSIVSAAFVLILVATKDLGGALLYFMTFLAMIYIATGKIYFFGSGIVMMGLASIAGYHMFSHVQTRVLAWKQPLAYAEKEAYQVCQSLFAIGTGGWWGLGLNQGVPEKIPVVAKDFIFAAITEELGAIFGLCLILICLNSAILFFHISMRMKDRFYKLVAAGLGTVYATQVILTIGGTIKFIPSTGVTLPLVSYGGSSSMASLIMFGIVQALYIFPIKTSEVESDYENYRKESMKEAMGLRSRKLTERALTVITTVYSIIFVAMGIYFSVFIQFKSYDFVNNPYNRVTDVLAEKVMRGSIYSSDGTVLAFSSVDIQGNETRYYPQNRLFAHAVGYSINGKNGIESSADLSLLTSHTKLSEKTQTIIAGEKQIGDNVITTLDFDLQNAAFEALSGYNGAILVMEPKTGRILAMVSKPDYNPNTLLEDWDKITTDGSSVLVNRATQGKYAPGSTFKIFTTIAYMRQYSKTFTDYTFNCTGSFTSDDTTIHCSSNHAHGDLNLKKSFAKSCNSSFSNITTKLDIDAYDKTCEELLFNDALPISYPSATSEFVLSKKDSVGTVMRTGIGQGDTLISPLHLLLVASAIDNDGELMRPYIVDRVESYDGKLVNQTNPTKVKRLLSEDEASVLQEYMRSTVLSGTGKKLANESYEVYGKTGTAQVSDSTDQTNAWFVCYAKKEGYEDIAVVVVVEKAGTGSGYAIPMANHVLKSYFQ